jgi:hypothetical protein
MRCTAEKTIKRSVMIIGIIGTREGKAPSLLRRARNDEARAVAGFRNAAAY